MLRPDFFLSALALVGILATATCHAHDNAVDVLYAGSLVSLMERSIGPAFEKETGVRFRGYAGGSNKLANEIKGKLRRGDVFISASPAVNANLMGAANGIQVRWYIYFAQSPLVIGYTAQSRFAHRFNTQRWEQALQAPGLRLGRTDPQLDPKGTLTVEVIKQAAQRYNMPDLVQKILGTPDNPAQVLPEETLIGRLQSGQLDAGFFYAAETAELNILTVRLPPELQAQARYTLTILSDAPHAENAARFIHFLLGKSGQAELKKYGFDIIEPMVAGDARAIPSTVRAILKAGP